MSIKHEIPIAHVSLILTLQEQVHWIIFINFKREQFQGQFLQMLVPTPPILLKPHSIAKPYLKLHVARHYWWSPCVEYGYYVETPIWVSDSIHKRQSQHGRAKKKKKGSAGKHTTIAHRSLSLVRTASNKPSSLYLSHTLSLFLSRLNSRPLTTINRRLASRITTIPLSTIEAPRR